MKRTATIIGLLLVWCALADAEITASQASNHIGETATVCGQVASMHYADRSRGNPTFINLDKPYPSQVFTIVIWGEDRAKFGRPEETYRDKHICVTGRITLYRGSPETIARQPSQIAVQ